MTKYIISKSDTGPIGEVIVNDDEMIVYDVCKIADYEGNDYLPRAAKKMDYHMLKEMLYPKKEEDDDEGSDADDLYGLRAISIGDVVRNEKGEHFTYTPTGQWALIEAYEGEDDGI